MRKKYDDETLEKIFYYYSLAGNRVLTAAQAAECLNLSESSLFRVIAFGAGSALRGGSDSDEFECKARR